MGEELHTVADLAQLPAMILKRQTEWDGDRFVPYAVFSDKNGDPVGVIDVDSTKGLETLCGCTRFTATLRSTATGKGLVEMQQKAVCCRSDMLVTDMSSVRRREVGRATVPCCSREVELTDALGVEVGRVSRDNPDPEAALHTASQPAKSVASVRGELGSNLRALHNRSMYDLRDVAEPEESAAEMPVDGKLLLIAGILQVGFAK